MKQYYHDTRLQHSLSRCFRFIGSCLPAFPSIPSTVTSLPSPERDPDVRSAAQRVFAIMELRDIIFDYLGLLEDAEIAQYMTISHDWRAHFATMLYKNIALPQGRASPLLQTLITAPHLSQLVRHFQATDILPVDCLARVLAKCGRVHTASIRFPSIYQDHNTYPDARGHLRPKRAYLIDKERILPRRDRRWLDELPLNLALRELSVCLELRLSDKLFGDFEKLLKHMEQLRSLRLTHTEDMSMVHWFARAVGDRISELDLVSPFKGVDLCGYRWHSDTREQWSTLLSLLPRLESLRVEGAAYGLALAGSDRPALRTLVLACLPLSDCIPFLIGLQDSS